MERVDVGEHKETIITQYERSFSSYVRSLAEHQERFNTNGMNENEEEKEDLDQNIQY